MLFARCRPAIARRGALRWRALMQRMRFGRANLSRSESADALVRMHVGGAIDPRPAPWMVVDEHGVRAPIEAAETGAPAPWPEERANGDPKAEADRATDRESRTRCEEHHRRIVI